MKYIIMYRYGGLPPEELEEYDSHEEAERMLAEYRLTTRNDHKASWWLKTKEA